jgi:histidinol-phosphatase (PHP family)
LDAETLAACCVTVFDGDGLAMAERYYGEVRRMAVRRPAILGHIDLITKFNERTPLFDETSSRYRTAALEALHAADPTVTLLEINTGAMSRGYRRTPYPALFLLEEWRRMGGGIILTADAHSASAIVYGYTQAAELARAAGFTRSVVLAAGGAAERSLP